MFPQSRTTCRCVPTCQDVSTLAQSRHRAAGRGRLLKRTTVAIDATTLEANAEMHSIVGRDTEDTYQEFLTRLARTKDHGPWTMDHGPRTD